MTTLLRRAHANALLMRPREYGGVLALDGDICAKWAAFGLTPTQIERAAHDLAREGAVRLAHDADGATIITITAKGGDR